MDFKPDIPQQRELPACLSLVFFLPLQSPEKSQKGVFACNENSEIEKPGDEECLEVSWLVLEDRLFLLVLLAQIPVGTKKVST